MARCRMAAAPSDGDAEFVGIGADDAGDRRHLANGNGKVVVCPEYLVARKTVEQPLVHHHLAAAAVLLGRLENEMHGAVEVAGFGKVAGGAEQHGRVAVMAAGVHAVGRLRPVREFVGLLHRQRVHVRPDPDRTAGAAIAERADQAGSGDPARYLDPPGRQLLRHDIARAVLLEREFGVDVQVATPRGQIGGEIGNPVVDRHARAPWARLPTLNL